MEKSKGFFLNSNKPDLTLWQARLSVQTLASQKKMSVFEDHSISVTEGELMGKRGSCSLSTLLFPVSVQGLCSFINTITQPHQTTPLLTFSKSFDLFYRTFLFLFLIFRNVKGISFLTGQFSLLF